MRYLANILILSFLLMLGGGLSQAVLAQEVDDIYFTSSDRKAKKEKKKNKKNQLDSETPTTSDIYAKYDEEFYDSKTVNPEYLEKYNTDYGTDETADSEYGSSDYYIPESQRNGLPNSTATVLPPDNNNYRSYSRSPSTFYDPFYNPWNMANPWTISGYYGARFYPSYRYRYGFYDPWRYDPWYGYGGFGYGYPYGGSGWSIGLGYNSGWGWGSGLNYSVTYGWGTGFGRPAYYCPVTNRPLNVNVVNNNFDVRTPAVVTRSRTSRGSNYGTRADRGAISNQQVARSQANLASARTSQSTTRSRAALASAGGTNNVRDRGRTTSVVRSEQQARAYNVDRSSSGNSRQVRRSTGNSRSSTLSTTQRQTNLNREVRTNRQNNARGWSRSSSTYSRSSTFSRPSGSGSRSGNNRSYSNSGFNRGSSSWGGRSSSGSRSSGFNRSSSGSRTRSFSPSRSSSGSRSSGSRSRTSSPSRSRVKQ